MKGRVNIENIQLSYCSFTVQKPWIKNKTATSSPEFNNAMNLNPPYLRVEALLILVN